MSKTRDRIARCAMAALCCALASFAFAPVVSADDARQTYGEAMAWYGEEARAGNPQARFLLGFDLETGARGAADPEAARGWYLAAARQGHERARVRLALMLLEGRGGAADPAAAAVWLEAAAGQGAADAMSILGYLLAMGEPADFDGAFRWLSLAAEAGDETAADNLAALTDAMGDDRLAQARAALEAWRAER